MHRGPRTVETVKEGLVRLERAITSLSREVSGASQKIKSFSKGKTLPRECMQHPWCEDWKSITGGFCESNQTPEPARHSGFAAELIEAIENPDIAVELIAAMARDIDGIMLDVRAIRSTIRAIQDDSDLRGDFKEWQKRAG